MFFIVFLSLFVLLINTSNCFFQNYNNFYFNSKSNESFYQDDRQNQININYFVFNINGKDVDIKKLLKLSDANTVEPVLNINNTEPTSNQNITNASEVTTIPTTTTTVENKDKEIEKELKVRDDYTLYPGHGYYKYHNNKASWNQASDICVKEGAHLVVINSQAEADLLQVIKKTNNCNGGISVGFYRISTNSEFITVLGGRVSESGYNKWYPGYPKTDNDYDCGYLWNVGTLFNHPCIYSYNNNFPFICEI